MYKATRDFIAARNKFTQPYGVAHIPHVKRIGGGVQHECYQNATSFMEKNTSNENIGMWCGWLVQPFDKITNSTLILAHWWNIKKTGEHVDTTPLNDSAEYVQDYSLQKFCVQNNGKLKTHLSHSLIFKDSKFSLITNPFTNESVLVNELSNEILYRDKWLR